MAGSDDEGCGRERILVVCTRYIGDTVLAIPFLRNLRRAFPHAAIEVCAEGAARAMLADCPYVDGFVAWRRPGPRRGLAAAFAAIRAQAAWLAGRRYARAYLLKRSLSATLLATLAGIPVRIGLAGDGRWLLTRAVAAARGRHQAARYLDLLRTEGIEVDEGQGENWVSPAVAGRVDRLLASVPAGRPRVFLAPCSTAPEKHWPVARWEALIEWLVLRRGCEVVLCGGPDDAATHDRLRAAVGGDVAAHVHDFSRALSLRETGGLLARMDACIGIDTGLVHLAAAHGVPVAVLVGPTDPNQWSPWTARGVVVRSARVRRPLAERLTGRPAAAAWPFGVAAMDDIGVEDVVVAVSALLPDPTPVEPAVPRPAVRSLDLRQGSFRYEVVAVDAGSPADVPVGSTG
jgi:heptosyltransferase-2